jgi:hypothetical protein
LIARFGQALMQALQSSQFAFQKGRPTVPNKKAIVRSVPENPSGSFPEKGFPETTASAKSDASAPPCSVNRAARSGAGDWYAWVQLAGYEAPHGLDEY